MNGKFVAIALALAAAASAQQASYPILRHPLNLDSGYLANPGNAAAVVWTQDVPVAGSDWLQLHFRDTNLPAGSRLRISSLARPDWVQWHDAGSLRDYEGFSCQFFGPTLRVELLAAAGSTGNRALIDEAIELQVGNVAEIDSICGTADNRVLSSDPRSCRLDAICSAWLFGPYAVGTAGHCMSTTSGHILHFNVPLSGPTGTPVPSHPNDQYPMEAFHPYLNGGIGSDWSVSAALRNSNTGLFPGQAQGSWYTVVTPPGTIAGVDIRITGYGTGYGTSGSATWNQVQKTHVGPRASTATANALSYVTDTTGGNSGSPVIHEQTGSVIGVHTHGGCTSSGGANSGTSSARTDWTSARNQVSTLHVVGEFSAFGTGCGAAFGVPQLGFTGIPERGRTITARASGLNPNGSFFGSLVLGFDNTTWSGGALPSDLTSYGLAGCQLLVDPQIGDGLFSAAGLATRQILIPNSAALVGLNAYFQYFGFDPTAATQVQMVNTNGARVYIGS